MHETGHIVACFLSGVKPRVELSVFGIKLCGYPRTRIKKFIVLICGPMVNLILSAVAKCFLTNAFHLDVYVFMVVNLVIFTFNCLPVFFLDGGQIFALFCNNSTVRIALDFISIIVVCVVAVVFSDNVIVSATMITLFMTYYFINKKTAF